MIKNNIRGYQQEIIETIMKRLKQNVREIFIEMPVGTGKSTLVNYLINVLDSKKHILIMYNSKVLEEQAKEDLKNKENIIISNYCTEVLPMVNFDYIILDNIESVNEEKYEKYI